MKITTEQAKKITLLHNKLINPVYTCSIKAIKDLMDILEIKYELSFHDQLLTINKENLKGDAE